MVVYNNFLMKNSFFLFLMGLSLFSCSDNEIDLSNPSSSNNPNIVLRLSKDIFDTIDNNRKNNISEGDSFSIIESKRNGDDLQITLSYSGGCNEHTFEIIWDGIVYADNPCKMNLLLIHRGNFDGCEALTTDTINIDLKKFMGNIMFKDTCSYHVFSTYNFSENPDMIIGAIN